MENVRKHRDIKLVTTEARRNYLASEPNYHANFFRTFISHRNKKTQIFVNKPVYLSLSILKLSKIVMYEFWYDYVKLKYGEKSKLCYMVTDSFIIYIKPEDICINI